MSANYKVVGKLFDSMGLDMQTAFRVFLKKAVSVKAMPFKIGEERDENGFTKKEQRELDKAIKEAKDPKNLIGPFYNAEDFIASLRKK